jgi:aldose 1-epimerase
METRDRTLRVGPSGAQYELRHGAHRAVITEVGATLRAYTVSGRSILDGFGPDAQCTGARGQTLIPWPNRIRSGRYSWLGEDQQLDLSEPEKHGAIHGLTRWAPWHLIERGEARARFGYVLHASSGWPFVLGCELDYSLDDDGLTVRTSATNLGRGACPYGTGAHPYLKLGEPTIDEAKVQVPAGAYLPVDGVGIPTGRRTVEGTPYDLRRPGTLGELKIDVAFADVRRDSDGRARVRTECRDGTRIALWLDGAYSYIQLYTGDTLPERERRRGLAVEPMTCPPDAFNSGEGLIILQPGESHTGTWGIEVTA